MWHPGAGLSGSGPSVAGPASFSASLGHRTLHKVGQLEQTGGLPLRRAHPENLIFLLECDSPGVQIYLGVLGFADPQKASQVRDPCATCGVKLPQEARKK